MRETLLHYSREPLVTVRSVEQGDQPDMKPRGLWVSVLGEDDWQSWCESEGFATETFKQTEITLAPDAKILRLSEDWQIIDLTRKFDVPGTRRTPHWRIMLDWRKVAALYQGIIIAPYSWQCRHHGETSWYYGWDCASGCIWDAAAVAELRPYQATMTSHTEPSTGVER